jgi:hypothetical protein
MDKQLKGEIKKKKVDEFINRFKRYKKVREDNENKGVRGS